MNTLHDLRQTLDQHAEGFDDAQRHARIVAVRGRVRAVRRRRAGVVAVAATAALVAGIAATTVELGPPPGVQPTAVVGVDVPEEVVVGGFPYDLGDTLTLRDGDRHDLPELDGDRALTLVGSGLGGGSATLYRDGEAIARVRSGEALAVPVPIGSTDPTLRIRYDGTPDGARAGVAVYEATGELAAGVSDPAGEVVFRDSVGGDRLLAAGFSEPGETETSVRFTGRFSDLRFSEYCASDEPGLWLNVEVDDQGAVSGPCDHMADDPTNDPGTSSSSFEGDRVRERVVRAYLTRGADGPVVSSASAVVGVAVYEVASDQQQALGMRVPSTVEFAGRTWVLDRRLDQPAGDRGPLRTTVDTADGDRLLGLVARDGTVGASWDGRLTDGASSYLGADRGSASAIGGILFAGDRYDVELASMDGAEFDGVIVIYRPE